MSDDELIVACAVRYALGRMSYIVGVVCDYVASKKDTLSQNCIKIIIRDIEEEMEHYHRLGHALGMECDEKHWEKLLCELKGCVRDD